MPRAHFLSLLSLSVSSCVSFFLFLFRYFSFFFSLVPFLVSLSRARARSLSLTRSLCFFFPSSPPFYSPLLSFCLSLFFVSIYILFVSPFASHFVSLFLLLAPCAAGMVLWRGRRRSRPSPFHSLGHDSIATKLRVYMCM